MRKKTFSRACMGAMLLASVGFVFAPGVATAQNEQLKLKRSFGLRGEGESHVQMRAIRAPVKRNASSLSTSIVPVTPVLTVKAKDKVGFVCQLGPRITDALLRAWYEKPMTLDYLFNPNNSTEHVYRISKSPSQQAEDARLIATINEALQDKLITEILVLRGTRQMGGGAISKLPFASVLGCAELETTEEPAEGEKKSH